MPEVSTIATPTDEVSVFSGLINLQAAAETPTITKLLYDRKSAAFALSLSVRSIDYLVSQKQLAFRKVGRKIMFAHSELLKFSRAAHSELTGRSAK